MSDKSFSILAVDDHDTILSGLKYELTEYLPGCKILTTEKIKKAIDIILKQNIRIAIIDISFKNENNIDGIELCKKIKVLKPTTMIICYTNYAERLNYIKLLQVIKVEAIVSKFDGNFAIKHAVSELLAGRYPFYSKEVFNIIQTPENNFLRRNIKITEREKEVLLLIHKHMKYRDIAEILNISKNTVDSHAKNLYKKFKVKIKSELIEVTNDILF